MKNRHQTLISTAVSVILLLVSIPAWSQGSLSTWVDACDVTDADLVQLLENEALVVSAAALTPNADETYALSNQAYTHWGCQQSPLCTSSRFYNQRQVGGFWCPPVADSYFFRSAMQVGPDLVLTAFHQGVAGTPFPEDVTGLVVIFGLQAVNAGGCIAPDFDHIPAANVFTVTELVADGLALPYDPPMDFLLLRLDRNARATYPRVRRSGQGRNGDSMTVISHPARLATKTDLAGTLTGYLTPPQSGPLCGNLHVLDGSSGGALYNRTERFIETVARWGVGAGYTQQGSCWVVTHFNGSDWTHEYSTVPFAQYIPAFELLVTPLDRVDHACQISTGTCSNAQTTRHIRAGAAAPGNVGYEIGPPDNVGTEPQLFLSYSPPSQGSLSPLDDGFTITATVSLNGASPGQYERTYTVTDATNTFVDVVRHRFTVSP